MKPIFTSTARQHVLSATEWYNSQEPNLGARFLSALSNLAQVLEIFPESAPLVDERFRRAQVRNFPYSMYYQVREHTVVVVAVLHTSQHPETWKQ